jgi:transcription initiation factor TFIIIB Brf1 subunit/transcription initiation factor TFIIB
MDNCKICKNELRGSWSDLHGEIVCLTCGAPYQILHYDDNNKRIEKPASINIKDYYVPFLRQYWQETKQHMGLGTFMGHGPRYNEYRSFMDWLNKNVPVPSTDSD